MSFKLAIAVPHLPNTHTYNQAGLKNNLASIVKVILTFMIHKIILLNKLVYFKRFHVANAKNFATTN